MSTNPIIARIASVNRYFGNCSEFEWLGKISKKPTSVYIDKLGRKIREYAHDAIVVAENKGGSKVVSLGTVPRVTVTFDKAGNVIREVTAHSERIFLPNGNFIEIGRIDGNRVGDFIAFTKAHPGGIDVRTYRTNGYSKYSSVTDLSTGKTFKIVSNPKKVSHIDERQWFREIAKLRHIYHGKNSYAPEVVRAILNEVI